MAIESVDIISPIILIMLSVLLSTFFIYKRIKTQVNALDYFIGVFVLITIMGIMELFKQFYINDWAIFKYASNKDTIEHSLLVDPVRLFHLLSILLLYYTSEQFLSSSFNVLRASLMSGLLAVYTGLSIYFVSTNQLIYADQLFSRLGHESVDTVIFDSIQLIVSILLLYVYIKQYMVSDSRQIRSNLFVIAIAIMIFTISSAIEFLEIFFDALDISGFLSTIPTLLILSYFYIRYPNFVYLTPSRVNFLQVVSKSGQLLYAAEMQDKLGTSDFLIAPSLTSVNTILGELVGQKDLQVKEMNYQDGLIYFEKMGENIIILQTDRPASILRRSMRYFLQVFNSEFQDQIDDFRGFIDVNDKNLSPDDVLRMCIPIVQAKALMSSYHRGSTKAALPKVGTKGSVETQL